MRIYAVGLLVMVALWIATAQPAAGQTVFEYSIKETVNVDEQGGAHIQRVSLYPPSLLTRKLQTSAKADIEGTKESVTRGFREGYALLGFEIWDSSCEITGLEEGENFLITLNAKVSNFAEFRSDENLWVISIRAYARSEVQEFLNYLTNEQQAIRELDQNSQRYLSSKSTIVLPGSAIILNKAEIENHSENYEFGGGSYLRFTRYIDNMGGKPAVVTESERLIVAENEITITAAELASAFDGGQIKYTGVPPPLGSDYLLYIGAGGAIATIIAIVLLVRRRGGEKFPEVPPGEW